MRQVYLVLVYSCKITLEHDCKGKIGRFGYFGQFRVLFGILGHFWVHWEILGHLGEDIPLKGTPIVPPIHQSSNFSFSSVHAFRKAFENEMDT